MASQTASLPIIPSVLGDDGSSGGSDIPLNRMDPDRWYFPKERLDTTPSRKSGVDADKELTYRQQSANFIQDIGQRLQVNQLCINTAIVYMHRFYMFHSFTQFHRNAISAASIFLAAKVEEQPRKLEHVIKVAHYCLHRDHQSQMDSKSEQYLEQSAELVMNENILLQTLGFDVAIDHPHTHVVKCCQLVRASKDLAQTSYFMATNSLHLTAMCLQYKPTVVACVCIHLACKWSSWEIPRSKEGKDWFSYVDDMVTTELLEKLTTDFLQIFNKSPSRLKKKIISLNAASSSSLSLSSGPYHGFDSSPGHHHQRSRSPSPKRPGSQKPTSSQGGVPGKPKPHGMPVPHHPMKIPYPPGAPGSANKHSSHGSSHPPHAHPAGHSSSGKPLHPGMPSGNPKDPHHPHHPQHPKNPYPPHGHAQHPQYPHPGRPSSGSSQSHHGHAMHSKPPVPGSTSSSSHPYSATSMKNMQTHPSKPPPHMASSGASKIPPNQVPGAVKNPSQAMFHSSQAHMKKPYVNEQGRPDFNMPKREGPTAGNVHHPQNHSRTHDKVMGKDGRHHPSNAGLPPSHNSAESRSASHHGMPYMGQDLDRSGSNSSNQKMPYLDSRSMDSSNDGNRHRNLQPSDAKRNMPHGASATNGNNNDGIGSLDTGAGSGAGDSHVPSKNAYRPPPGTGSGFGQNSQQDVGANKYNADGFGGEFGSYGSNSAILSIEDRRKRRHAEMSMGSSGLPPNSKRPRTDTYAAPSVPSLSSNSLFSPEELSDSSSKRLPPPTSQFSPSAVEGTHTNYGKPPERSQLGTGSSNAYGGPSSDGIVFGSSGDLKPDIRRVNPLVEFQAPDLLQPISDVIVKNEPLSLSGSGNAPRAASLFSPEFTPTNSIPPNLSISPLATAADIHKRDPFSHTKLESVDQQSSSGYSEGSSQVSFTGRLSNSPKREEAKDADDSHSSKKSKKKKEKHKHKHKEEKKHKKDKHKDKEKEKEKDKKDKHRSKDKHSTNPPPPEVSNDVSSHKIKIKLGRDDSKSSSVQSASRHSSSKTTNSATNSITTSLPGLKVKISSKARVSSVDDDIKNGPPDKHGSPGDESTPCCPGFGPCLTCNREPPADQYRFFSSGPSQGLTLKLSAKSKETSKSSKDSSSRDSKKAKDKTKISGSSTTGSASHGNSLPAAFPNPRNNIAPGNHHLHKNGMEKSSKKK